jgi:hypothetical protein
LYTVENFRIIGFDFQLIRPEQGKFEKYPALPLEIDTVETNDVPARADL